MVFPILILYYVIFSNSLWFGFSGKVLQNKNPHLLDCTSIVGPCPSRHSNKTEICWLNISQLQNSVQPEMLEVFTVLQLLLNIDSYLNSPNTDRL